jgi:hypothetical protein
MIYIGALALLILIGSLALYLLRKDARDAIEIKGEDFEIVE